MNKCRTCGIKIIPSWKMCQKCSKKKKPKIIEIPKRVANLELLLESKKCEDELYRAIHTIETYQAFFNHFAKKLKPMQKEWNKMQKELSTME